MTGNLSTLLKSLRQDLGLKATIDELDVTQARLKALQTSRSSSSRGSSRGGSSSSSSSPMWSSSTSGELGSPVLSERQQKLAEVFRRKEEARKPSYTVK